MALHDLTRDTAATHIPEPPLARFLFADTRIAWFWLVVRLYCAGQWIEAGWQKLQSPAWFGSSAGGALSGFVNGALQKTGGDHPDVAGWYASFLQAFVLPNATLWANLVSLGELLVGFGLLVGALTGVAAFAGTLMNANYLLAGTVSTNPLLFILGTWLVLAWRVAGWWGLDRWLLPLLGTPWAPRRIASHTDVRAEPAERREPDSVT
ncbi:MAG: DoxX family protein [Chloroflexota bacterium]